MSHPYMTSNAPGDPSKSAYQEILYEDRARVDHVVDLFPRCRCIMNLAQTGINI